MANIDNLIPNSERTPTERQEIARNGGIASGESRREKKRLQEALQRALEGEYTVEGKEDKVSGYEAVAIALIQKALKGDVSAINSLRDSIGEKPTDKVEVDGQQAITGIQIEFVDKSSRSIEPEVDPKIVGEYTPPQGVRE